MTTAKQYAGTTTPPTESPVPANENQMTFKNLDRDLVRRIKAEAALRGVPLGHLMNEVMREWLERRQAETRR